MLDRHCTGPGGAHKAGRLIRRSRSAEGGLATGEVQDVRHTRHDLFIVVGHVDEAHVHSGAELLHEAEHSAPTSEVEALTRLVEYLRPGPGSGSGWGPGPGPGPGPG